MTFVLHKCRLVSKKGICMKKEKNNQATLANTDKSKRQSPDHMRRSQLSPVTQMRPLWIAQLLRWVKNGFQKSSYHNDHNWRSLNELKRRNILEETNSSDVARQLFLTPHNHYTNLLNSCISTCSPHYLTLNPQL